MTSEDFSFRPPQVWFNNYDSIAEKNEVLLKSKTPDTLRQLFAWIGEDAQFQHSSVRFSSVLQGFLCKMDRSVRGSKYEQVTLFPCT
jgi:hypothetical protein